MIPSILSKISKVRVLVALMGLTALLAGSGAAQVVPVGGIARNFTLTNRATGRPLKLTDYAGKVVVLDFFAYWCGPCQASSPDVETNIQEYYQARGGNVFGVPVQVIAVNIEDANPALTDAFVTAAGLELVGDDFSATATAYSQFNVSNGIPLFVIINGVAGSPSHAQWQVLYKQAGYAGATTFRNVIDTVQRVATAPEIAVEQPAGTNIVDGGSKDFGSVAVGANTSLSFTISNTGTANLTGIAITRDGPNVADFTVTSSPASSVGGPNGTTTFTVAFAPSAEGTRTAAIHIANNDANENPFDIILSGTGFIPVPEIAVEQTGGGDLTDGGAAIDFGSITLGFPPSVVTFTIHNLGTANLTGLVMTKGGPHAADFTVSTLGASTLAAGGSTTFTVTFAPAAAGSRTAAIHIASNDADENPFDINLAGTGLTPAPEIVVELPGGNNLDDGNSSIGFGNVTLGFPPAVITFTIKNHGTANLTGLAVTKDGTNAADFTVGTLGATTLANGTGASTTFTVTFAPAAAGSRTAAIHIASNDADENPFDINLSGSGLTPAPEIVVELPGGINLEDGNTSLNFASVLLGGASSTYTLTVRNLGTANLTGLTVTKDGTNAADYSVGTLGSTTLAMGASTTFMITFTPGAAGPRTAAIHIANNDADENPFDMDVTGIGQAPAPEIAVEQPVGTNLADGSASIHFGMVSLGSVSGAIPITVRNIGTANLTGLAVTKDGANAADFTVGALGATSLAVGASTTFTVTFAPGAAGARTAAIHIASDDADENPFDIQILGNISVGGAIDQPGLSITSGVSAPWLAQAAITHDGVDAACSGAINHNQESWMQTTLTGPGTLTYWWKVSSELGYDCLEFYLDGTLQSGRISGAVDWQHKTYGISNGTHTVMWRYMKDASGSGGTDAGWVDEVVFVPAITTPTVTTGIASGLTTSSATLNGTVNPNGLPSAASFEYGLTAAYGGTVSVTLSPANGSAAQNVSAGISALQPGATYHYRLTATNSSGMIPGADMTFVTASQPPTVTTGGASGITTTTATLNGTVNPHGVASTVRFEYGLTAAYGGTVSVTLSPANGSTAQNVSAGISGLQPTTTYHYRLLAIHSSGPVPGADMTFVTADMPPEKTTPVIVWANPAAITYGKPLSATQLNAKTNVLGNFTYTPGAGSKLAAGTQPLNVSFTPKDPVHYTNAQQSVSLTVNKAAAKVTLSGLNQTYNGQPRPVKVTTVPAGLMVDITYDGAAAVPANAGSYDVTATVVNNNYSGVKTGKLVIAKGRQTITFPVPPALHFGDADRPLAAIASSGLTVSYAGSAPTVATIVDGNLLHIAGAGKVVLTASQAGDANWNPATAVRKTLSIGKADQSIAFSELGGHVLGEADFAPAATATSGLTVSYASASPKVATVVAGKIHLVGIGSAVITATQAGNPNWNAAIPVKRTLTVQAARIASPAVLTAMTAQADAQDIQAFYAVMRSRIEAHDMPGFFALFASDYLHQGQSLADQFDGEPDMLDPVDTFQFDITGITVTGDDAVVSGDAMFLCGNGDAAEIWAEPDTTDQSPGIGWLRQTPDGWRVIGDQKRAKVSVQGCHDTTSAKDTWFLRMWADSSLEVTGVSVSGPGIPDSALEPDPDQNGYVLEVGEFTSLTLPPAGTVYTFDVMFADGSHATYQETMQSQE